MGAKSSFAMLALTHHVIVQILANRVGLSNFTDYGILGDDNTIANRQVANLYVPFMTSLGVSISMSKSFVHVDGYLSVGEICKRIFIEGVELTSFNPKLIVKCSRYGHMAPSLQNLLEVRGSPIPDSFLFEFFAGFLGQKALTSLLMLNVVPEKVSGLIRAVDPKASHIKPFNWFKGLPISFDMLIEVYTYTLVVEQLKRLGALIRSTLAMHDVISIRAHPIRGPFSLRDYHVPFDNEEQRQVAQRLPRLNENHPIVPAAKAEVDRVLAHLDDIRSGTPEMIARARHGLLDLLRNSLSEIWVDRDPAARVAERTLFNGMMDNLKLIVSRPDQTISFETLVHMAERRWSVYYRLGDKVRINHIVRGVNISTIDSERKLRRTISYVNPLKVRI
jgi:hypothetical protein